MSKYDWLVWPETRDATKPGGFSQADRDVASMAVANAPEYTKRLHEDVAHAIRAEREECALVVDALVMVLTDEIAAAKTRTHVQALSAQRHAVLAAAAAIRVRGEPKPTKHPSWGDREPFSPVPDIPDLPDNFKEWPQYRAGYSARDFDQHENPYADKVEAAIWDKGYADGKTANEDGSAK